MSAAWSLVRVLFWVSLCLVLVALLPVGIALRVIGDALLYVAQQYRSAVVWTFDRAADVASAEHRRPS